jgi:hypothetical protein
LFVILREDAAAYLVASRQRNTVPPLHPGGPPGEPGGCYFADMPR